MNKLKKYLNWQNALFLVVLLILVAGKIPSMKRNFQFQGAQVQSKFEIIELSSDQMFSFPTGKKQLVVFWATWCGPCKVELSRLQNLVNLKKLQPHDVLAISLDDDRQALVEDLKKSNYGFAVVHDENGTLRKFFEIQGTPTIMLIDEQDKIVWRTTGISPSLEARALSFFGN